MINPELLEKIRELENENHQLRITLERARLIHSDFMQYLNHNTLNFQLEKAEYYFQKLQAILENK